MTKQRIGINALQDNRIERTKLRRVLEMTQSTAFHTVNRYELAQDALDALPTSVIIYRATDPAKDPDESQHLRYSPSAWMDKFTSRIDDRMYISCLNEPDGGYTRRALDFVLECMHIGKQRGKRLVVYNFNPGTPHEVLHIGAGLLDDLYKALADGFHILGTHSYANTREMMLSSPWLVGRDFFHIERARHIGVKPPRIVVTELGYAELNGKGRKGWKSWDNMSGSEYAAQLIALDTSRHTFVEGRIFTAGYGDMPEVEGYCLFSYGDSGGWAEDDVRSADELWSAIASYRSSGKAPLPRPLPVNPPIITPPVIPAPVPVPVPTPPPDTVSPAVKAYVDDRIEQVAQKYLAAIADGIRKAAE